ncbi:MAG: T9SS type A sorting domain-containing protein [Bacteroidetes bacterium]|nr:T9SS type A sorting domain-containing protein [Bacteroidota bacterium]
MRKLKPCLLMFYSLLLMNSYAMDSLRIKNNIYIDNSEGIMYLKYHGADYISYGTRYFRKHSAARYGLIRIISRNTMQIIDNTKGFPDDMYITSMAVYRDTLLAATTKGIYFITDSTAQPWWLSGVISATEYYSLSVQKNYLLVGCDTGIVLAGPNSIERISDFIAIPKSDFIQCAFAKSFLTAIINDTLYQYEPLKRKLSKYKIEPGWNVSIITLGDRQYIHKISSIDYFMVLDNKGLRPLMQSINRCDFTGETQYKTSNFVTINTCSRIIGYNDTEFIFRQQWDCPNTSYIPMWGIMNDHGMEYLIDDRLGYLGPYDIENAIIGINNDTFLSISKNYIYYINKNDIFNEIRNKNRRIPKLDIGQLRMSLNPVNFHQRDLSTAGIVRDEDCLSTIFGRSLWFGGKDSEDSIHFAATTYLQNGNDYLPGPLLSNGTTNDQLQSLFKKVWSISRDVIEAHQAEFNLKGKVTHVHPDISDWPAYYADKGDTIQIAPWEDVNKNGIYDPENGDFPKIKGNMALFAVYNDMAGAPQECIAPRSGIQVNAMLYGYHCPLATDDSISWILDHTVFVESSITLKGKEELHDAIVAEWSDMDIGMYNDDYIGSAPTYNFGFTYNSDTEDEGYLGSGHNPGSQNLIVLKGPRPQPNDGIDNNNNGITDESDEQCLMSYFGSYLNNFNPLNGNPHNASAFYNICFNRLNNGNAKFVGSDSIRFLYSHGLDPDHPMLNYNQKTSNENGNNQRMVVSSGPFSIKPGQTIPFHIAYFYTRNYSDSNQLPFALKASALIKNIYEKSGMIDCWQLNTINAKLNQNTVELYPNPGNNLCHLTSERNLFLIRVYDLLGNQVPSTIEYNGKNVTIRLNSALPGIYIVQGFNDDKPFNIKWLIQE